MLLDANLLLYAIDTESVHHPAAVAWVEAAFNGEQRVGVPLQTVGTVARIATHPKIMAKPMGAVEVSRLIEGWLDLPNVWVPSVGEQTCRILGRLITAYGLTGNLVPDGQLAAMAIENGLAIASTDTDFARFTEITWVNPLAR